MRAQTKSFSVALHLRFLRSLLFKSERLTEGVGTTRELYRSAGADDGNKVEIPGGGILFHTQLVFVEPACLLALGADGSFRTLINLY